MNVKQLIKQLQEIDEKHPDIRIVGVKGFNEYESHELSKDLLFSGFKEPGGKIVLDARPGYELVYQDYISAGEEKLEYSVSDHELTIHV